MERKIFQIGFNRSGTTSLYKWFKQNNINAVHFEIPDSKRNLALAIHENIRMSRRPLEGFESFSFYSDMEFVSSTLITDFYTRFELLDRYYPGSKFIFNYRSLEDWIRSRNNHGKTGKYARDVGRYTQRYMDFYGLSEKQVEELWRRHFHEHYKNVIEYFESSPSQLFIMDLDNFSSQELIDFLPEYLFHNENFPISNTGPK